MQTTGQITDLALEGTSYFAYSNGKGISTAETAICNSIQPGMVCPTNGYALQGMMAASDETYPVGSTIGEITVPFGQAAPAKPTAEVAQVPISIPTPKSRARSRIPTRFFGVGRSGQCHHPNPDPTLTSLFDPNGNSLGIVANDVLTISATDSTGTAHTATLTVAANTTLSDLVNAISGVVTGPGFSVQNVVTQNPNGSININTSGGAVINDLQVTSSRPGSNSYVANAFSWGPSIPMADATGVDSDKLLRPAQATDPIANIMDASGNALGLQPGDTISINGEVGGQNRTYRSRSIIRARKPCRTCLIPFREAFNLPQTDGTPQNNLSVSMNPADTPDDNIPDGSIAIRGQKETAFALQNLSISANNSNQDATAPTALNANMATTDIQAARDTAQPVDVDRRV